MIVNTFCTSSRRLLDELLQLKMRINENSIAELKICSRASFPFACTSIGADILFVTMLAKPRRHVLFFWVFLIVL